MADLNLRQLEMASAAHPEDEYLAARVIVGRLRAELLTEQQVELAALLQHRPTLLALGRQPETALIDPDLPMRSVGNLMRDVVGTWGKEAALRGISIASHAGIGKVRDELVRSLTWDFGSRAAYSWSAYPSQREYTEQLTRQCMPTFEEFRYEYLVKEGYESVGAFMALSLGHDLSDCVITPGNHHALPSQIDQAACSATKLLSLKQSNTPLHESHGPVFFDGAEQCVRLIRSALVPWALRRVEQAAA